MSNTIYTDAMRAKGLADAADLQSRAPEMDGTALYAEEEKIPDFQAARQAKNMNQRKAGREDGFMCRSTVGHVMRLNQNYDSDTYPQEPEDPSLAAFWIFVYSKNPKKARPFLNSSAHMSESYYSLDECCTENGHVYRSTLNGANVWAPSVTPQYWEDLGTIEEVMAQEWEAA